MMVRCGLSHGLDVENDFIEYLAKGKTSHNNENVYGMPYVHDISIHF